MRARLVGLHKATKRLSGGRIAVYAYAWRTGPLVARGEGRTLADANADLERLLGQSAALEALESARRPIRVVEDKAYIRGLIVAFKASPEWAKLGESSKREYTRYLDSFDAEFGDWKVRLFDEPATKADLVDWRDDYADRPRAADYAMQSVSRLFAWARGRGLTKARPTEDVPRLYDADRADLIWTDEDLAKLLKEATPEIGHGVKLAAEIGLRTGDLLKLTWSEIGQHGIVRRTRKRKRQAVIPLTPEARSVLAAIPKRGPIVLTNASGAPWTPGGFKTMFRRAKLAAGLTDLHFHDLRGTACTRMFIAGSPKRDLATIFAWSEEAVDALLTKYVSSDAVALDLLSRMKHERHLQTGDKPVLDSST
ncbi:tyrosine-type recombinase/integrase [Brevundimonas balnearis]|uniref:Tyrosine-type recombinase/integrase n=1 Tax=Brevundimonas balnearis TaxID=1572858 RepID=A0ABV6R3T2_9CAUL